MNEEKRLNIKFTVIGIICIILFTIAIVPKGLQNDTFYTIKIGELILNNGIDMQDHFSWHQGLAYTYPHWLYDVGIYLIYNLGGFNGIYISTIIFTIVLGIAIYLTSSKLSKNTIIPLCTTIFVMCVGSDFFTARAQLITFTLFVLTIYNIEMFLETKKKRYAAMLILIPAIIANVHCAVFPFYFVLYLPYIGEEIVRLMTKDGGLIVKTLLKIDESTIKRLSKKEKLSEKENKKLQMLIDRVEKNKTRIEDKKKETKEPYKIIVTKNANIKYLIIIMIIAAFTGFLTPIGTTPYTYLVKTMMGTTTQNISEHLPIVLYNAKYTLFFMSFIIIIIAFTKVKVKLSDLFLIGGLIFLTIMSRRQESLLLFIGIIVVNKIIVQLINLYDDKYLKDILKYATTIIAQILIYAFFVTYMILALNKSKDVKIVSDKDYPIEACEYIKENLDIDNIKLYNEYNFGSYILYQDIPVFIDSRADLYAPEFSGWEDDIFRDFMNISGADNKYEEKFEHYGITHLLIYKNNTLNKVLQKDENYHELYSDENFIIYERLTANKGE